MPSHPLDEVQCGNGKLHTSWALARYACAEHQPGPAPQAWRGPQGRKRRPREEGLETSEKGPESPAGGRARGRGRTLTAGSEAQRTPRTERRAGGARVGGVSGEVRAQVRGAPPCAAFGLRLLGPGRQARGRRPSASLCVPGRDGLALPLAALVPGSGRLPRSARFRSGLARWRLSGGARSGRPRAAGRQSAGARAGTGQRGEGRAAAGGAGPCDGRGLLGAGPRERVLRSWVDSSSPPRGYL